MQDWRWIQRLAKGFTAICLALGLWLSCGTAAWADGFVLCRGAGCDRADYFVGYGHSSQVNIAGAVAQDGEAGLVVYPNVADLMDQDGVNRELSTETDGASAQDSIDSVRMGDTRKHHRFSLGAEKSSDATATNKIKTTSMLVWGDTLEITSKRLPGGSPVALRIERIVENEKAAATDGSSARLTVQTWVDGRQVPKLKYQLAKFAGKGESDREQGDREASVSALVPVGSLVRLESRLQVDDGLVASETDETFEGSHGVSYRVVLDSDDSCARSQSGLLTTGDCD